MRRPLIQLAAGLLTGICAQCAWGQAPAPAGDADVMRPTERGLRLNPVMARSMMRLWVREDKVWRGLGLDERQQRRIADTIARRTMRLAHSNGPEVRDGFEFLFESLMTHEGDLDEMTPEDAKVFGERMLPLIQSGRQWLDGIVDDARPHLNDEQIGKLQQEMDWQRVKVERFEQRMQAWSRGESEAGENPFKLLESDEGKPNVPEEPKQSDAVRQARQSARWEVRRHGNWEWDRILTGLATMFKFTPEQRARGEALVTERRAKAKEIMTPQWREQLMINRMLYNSQWQLGEVPRGPWRYQLEQEYRQAIRPMEELTDTLIRDLLALVTPEQRVAAIESIRETAEKHGMVFDESDVALLGLAAPPATQQAAGE